VQPDGVYFVCQHNFPGSLIFIITTKGAGTSGHLPHTFPLRSHTPGVEWPRAFKDGLIRGPEAIRSYWTEQWSEVSPHVEPVAFHAEEAGRILVDVHQVVRDLAGTILADEHGGHRFTIEQGLIRRMEVCPLPWSQKLSAHSRGVDAARE
jgi:hypothetical protein